MLNRIKSYFSVKGCRRGRVCTGTCETSNECGSLAQRRKGWKADDVDPNVNVNVSVTLSDIVKEISSKPHQLPKFKKEQFMTIDNERKEDAAPVSQPEPTA